MFGNDSKKRLLFAQDHTGDGGDDSIVNVIVAGGRGEADFGPGDEQDDDDIESSSSSPSSVWSKLSCSFIESTISESAE